MLCVLYICNFLHNKSKIQLGSLKLISILLAIQTVSVTWQLGDRDRDSCQSATVKMLVQPMIQVPSWQDTVIPEINA